MGRAPGHIAYLVGQLTYSSSLRCWQEIHHFTIMRHHKRLAKTTTDISIDCHTLRCNLCQCLADTYTPCCIYPVNEASKYNIDTIFYFWSHPSIIITKSLQTDHQTCLLCVQGNVIVTCTCVIYPIKYTHVMVGWIWPRECSYSTLIRRIWCSKWVPFRVLLTLCLKCRKYNSATMRHIYNEFRN